MKRVVMFGNYIHTGGALEVFRNIAKYSRDRGWEPHYLAHGMLGGGDTTIPEMNMFSSAEVIELTDKSDMEEYTKRLAERLNEFDLIHTSLIPLDWRHRIKSKLTVPQIETYHSTDGWIRAWKQYSLRLKFGVEKLVPMVAVSKGLQKKMQGDLAGLGADVRMIYNGVDIPPNMAKGGPYITYCGRISADKGLDVWLKVANEVRRLNPDAKFQWIGGLSPQYHPFCFKLLVAACPWIEFVGHQVDPSPYYDRASCLLLTSASEGLPMTILEAQARGIPAIAFDVGDIGETHCCLVGKGIGEVEAMATAVRMYLNRSSNDYECDRERVIAKFHAGVMAEKYCQLYGEIYDRDRNNTLPQVGAIY